MLHQVLTFSLGNNTLCIRYCVSQPQWSLPTACDIPCFGFKELMSSVAQYGAQVDGN